MSSGLRVLSGFVDIMSISRPVKLYVFVRVEVTSVQHVISRIAKRKSILHQRVVYSSNPAPTDFRPISIAILMSTFRIILEGRYWDVFLGSVPPWQRGSQSEML
jgi:hypothetical protein